MARQCQRPSQPHWSPQTGRCWHCAGRWATALLSAGRGCSCRLLAMRCTRHCCWTRRHCEAARWVQGAMRCRCEGAWQRAPRRRQRRLLPCALARPGRLPCASGAHQQQRLPQRLCLLLAPAGAGACDQMFWMSHVLLRGPDRHMLPRVRSKYLKRPHTSCCTW